MWPDRHCYQPTLPCPAPCHLLPLCSPSLTGPLLVLRCLHMPRYQVPATAFPSRGLAHCQAAHLTGGWGGFKSSLIRETIGGCEEGKGKVVDGFKVCQNSGCTPEEPHGSGKRGRERQAGTGTLCCHPVTHPLLPSMSGCVGTVEEQRAGYILSFVSLCSMSGKLIALDLSFHFCTIRVEIPPRCQKVIHLEEGLATW